MATLTRIEKGDLYEFVYFNHRGQYNTRVVEFDHLSFGTVETYYPEPTMLFNGFDHVKGAQRSFDVAKIDMTTFKRVG